MPVMDLWMGSSLLLILILSKDMNNLLMFGQFFFLLFFQPYFNLYGYGLKKLVENKHYLLFFAIYYYAIKHIEIY